MTNLVAFLEIPKNIEFTGEKFEIGDFNAERFNFLIFFNIFWQGVKIHKLAIFSCWKSKFKAKFWHKCNYGNGTFDDMIWPTPFQGHLQ